MAEKKSNSKAIIALILIVGGIFWVVKLLTGPGGNDIVGKWQFSPTGDIMLFKADSKFEINVDDSLYNYGDYRLDLSQSPGHIVIIPKKVLWFAGYPALALTNGIIRFTDKNVIEIAFKIDPGSRQIGSDFPDTFDYPSIKVTLQRLP